MIRAGIETLEFRSGNAQRSHWAAQVNRNPRAPV
jgi:hypothetical protein